MKLHDLTAVPGSTRVAKRIGRGHGSGQGKTAGKGHKGQKARSGYSMRPDFEGGQMPYKMRVPRRGFNNIFSKTIVSIKVGSLIVFEDGAVFDAKALCEAGWVKKACYGIKVLSNGTLTKKLTVQVAAFSEAAKQKIEAAGGKAEVI